jgi:hypothetical protein
LRRGGRRAAANAVRQEFAGAEIGARLNVIADTVIQNVTGNATGSE